MHARARTRADVVACCRVHESSKTGCIRSPPTTRSVRLLPVRLLSRETSSCLSHRSSDRCDAMPPDLSCADQRPCRISPMVRLLHVLLWKRDQTMLLCSSVTSHAPISNLMRRNQSDHNRHYGRGDGYYVRQARRAGRTPRTCSSFRSIAQRLSRKSSHAKASPRITSRRKATAPARA